MSISVVVPFFNAERYIEGCISRLLDQDYPGECYEIIMVDNNSTDDSAEIVRRYPEIVLLSAAKQGAYAARNVGLARARNDIVAFTDPDCAAARDWLGTIEDVFRDRGTDIVVGSHVPGNDVFILSLMFGYMNERSRYVFTSDMRELYYGYTNNMAVRRHLFEELGLFMERKRGGDTVFVQKFLESYPCSRVRYDPRMLVRHLEILSVRDLYSKFFLYARSRKQYRHVARVRALTNRERLSIFRSAMKSSGYSVGETLLSFVLLAVGAGFWYWGDLTTRSSYREQGTSTEI